MRPPLDSGSHSFPKYIIRDPFLVDQYQNVSRGALGAKITKFKGEAQKM